MTAEIPPIVDDHRVSERRKNWHTPQDCPKVSEFQDALDSIFGHLKEGSARMDGIERRLEANHIAATDGLNRLASSQEENRQDMSRVRDIVEMGEGFFKGIRFIGKWARKMIMWFGPPASILLGIWYTIRPQK